MCACASRRRHTSIPNNEERQRRAGVLNMSDNRDDIKQLFAHLGLNPGDYREVRPVSPSRIDTGESPRRWPLLQGGAPKPESPLEAAVHATEGNPAKTTDWRQVVDAAFAEPPPTQLIATDIVVPHAHSQPVPRLAGTLAGDDAKPDENAAASMVDGLQSLFESVQESALRFNAASMTVPSTNISQAEIAPPIQSSVPTLQAESSPASPQPSAPISSPSFQPPPVPMLDEPVFVDSGSVRPAVYPGRLQLSLKSVLDPAQASGGESLQEIFRRIAAGGAR